MIYWACGAGAAETPLAPREGTHPASLPNHTTPHCGKEKRHDNERMLHVRNR